MEKLSFSPEGEYLSVAGLDGRLRIWETATNVLKQEFVPSSHLSALCTCIEWVSSTKSNSSSKKKKKKKVHDDLIILGTSSGSIIYYGFNKSESVGMSNDAHLRSVTGLSFSHETLLLYSCGEDGFIREWEIDTFTSQSRWKASKSGGVRAVRVFGKFLLSASQAITLWDLQTKTSINTFTGHSTQVAQLDVIPSTDYFISMGQNDRHLKIWCNSEKNSIATLVVPEEPSNFYASINSEDGQIFISVQSFKGPLYLFHHKLNGHMKKPLMPKITFNMKDFVDSTKSIPVLASYLRGVQDKMLIAYGSWAQLRFENFEISTLDPSTTITREYFSGKKEKRKKSSASETTNQERIEIPNDVKHLQPGSEAQRKYDLTTNKKKKKDKDGNSSSKGGKEDLPMEERLSNLTIELPSSSSSSESLSHLLSQGLHSKDEKILHSVLSRFDENIIISTVRSLPVQLITPLLNEIKVMLGGKGQVNHSILKWLKIIFQVHSSYLMCSPSSEELLGPFMSLLRTREVLYPQMCQLRGKLELIKGHINAKKHKEEPPNEALLVFNDESSEDEDNLVQSESEGFITSDEDLGIDEENDDLDGDSESDEDNSNKNVDDQVEKDLNNDDEMDSASGEDDSDNDAEEPILNTSKVKKARKITDI